MSEKYGWETDFVWSTHGAKYAAAEIAMKEAKDEGKSAHDSVNHVKSRTAHLSARMVEQYCQPMEEKRNHYLKKVGKGYEWLPSERMYDHALPMEEENTAVLRRHLRTQQRERQQI